MPENLPAVTPEYFLQHDHTLTREQAVERVRLHNAEVNPNSAPLYVPPRPNPPADQVANAARARAELDSLTKRRMNDEISDSEWRELQPRIDELGEAISATTPDPLDAQTDKAFAPPATALEYRLSDGYARQLTDAEHHTNVLVAEAFHREQVPMFVGRNMGTDAARLTTLFETLPEAELNQALAQHRDEVRRGLAQTWGQDADRKFSELQRYAREFAAREPGVAEYVQLLPYLSASTLVSLGSWLERYRR